MIVLDHAPFVPFMDARTAKPPGLMPLDMADWTLVHPDFAAQMAYRAELLARERDTVLACLPEGEAAALELLSAVLAHLGRRPDYAIGTDDAVRPDGVRVSIDRGKPLTTLGHLVAEDFCLLLPDAASGEYRLVAAVLCFPSRWLLAEKLGRPLTIIHDPVPDYDETLARRVNRVFEVLHESRPLVRVNWLVHRDPELFLPIGTEAKRRLAPDAPGPLYLRTERQGMVRLAQTQAAVFSIKTSITPMACLDKDQAAGLFEALGGVDAAGLAYRGATSAREQALADLAQRAGLAPPN